MTRGTRAQVQRRPHCSAQPKKRPGEVVLAGVISVAALAGIVTVVVVLTCLVTGVRPAIVISGSMEPTIPVGSMTFAQPVDASSVKIGDVVTVDRVLGDGLVTHRVVGVADEGGVVELTLQGDANTGPDPTTYPVETVGKVVLHVPVLGTFAAALRTPAGMISVVALILAFVVLSFLPKRRAVHVQ